jgi:RNA polymerase sigma factor (sigma-70 family)
LTTNLALVERAVAFACRRYRLDTDDAEEFASVVKLRLVDDDYAILRAYEARCAFSTYISVVVQRMALDYRIHAWGKWHPSAEAKRLGDLAVELEKLLHRDKRSLDEAIAVLAGRYEGVNRESLAELADRMPRRAPRPRDVALDEAESVPSRGQETDEPLYAQERRRAGERLSSLMSAVMQALPEDDRLILQLRFEGGMTVAQIARSLRLDQKLLYRRLERRMRDIREELERAGVAPGEVLDLIGRDDAELDFDLGKPAVRPSMSGDERAATESEGSQ